jgi:hypothetical protein
MPAYTTQSAQAELAYPGPLAQAAQGDGVKRLQEWLTLSGRGLVLNGDFGPATARALAAFQADNGLFPSATLDEGTWNALTAPMQNALDAQPDPGVPYDIAVWQVARAHMRQGAAEVGGDNRGPWVRLYARGTEGKEVQWCAYFVTFILKQTATARGSSAPLRGSSSCDTLARQAQDAGRFVEGSHPDAKGNAPKLQHVSIFLERKSPIDWVHTGFAYAFQAGTFQTIEGNYGDKVGEGGERGIKTRSLNGKYDFITIN